eukprot:Platyproteum_vivax@DN2122_c0_g1_i1.p1
MTTATSGKVQRWSLFIQQFDIEIRTLPGEMNVIANWLIRSVGDDDADSEIEEIAVPTYPVEGMATLTQVVAPYLPTLKDLVDEAMHAPEEELRQTVLLNDGLRYSSTNHYLYIPPRFRESLIFWFHASRFGGHCGISRSIRRLKANKIWWPNLAKDVRNYVNNCLICLRKGRLMFRNGLEGVLS